MKKNKIRTHSYLSIPNLVFALLLSVLFVVSYTYVLQTNYSNRTFEATVTRNIQRSNAVYRTLNKEFTASDFSDINSTSDMTATRYHDMQMRLNELRDLKNICTPMNAILGYSDLARKHLYEPQLRDEYMNNIHISGEKKNCSTPTILPVPSGAVRISKNYSRSHPARMTWIA